MVQKGRFGLFDHGSGAGQTVVAFLKLVVSYLGHTDQVDLS